MASEAQGTEIDCAGVHHEFLRSFSESTPVPSSVASA